MYAILSGGEVIALCEKPPYVKLNEDSGAYVKAQAEDATGISVRGVLYNINGSDAIPGAPSAVVSQGDISEMVFESRVKISENEAATGSAIAAVEDALCDIDTAAEERIASMENALCEIDIMLSEGGTTNE